MKRYFGYMRVSTPKQGQGVSLHEQKDAILAHARRHGLTIAEWFEEKETAAKTGRSVFTKMLAELERGRAHGVVIHKIDRSARNLWDWANLAKLIDRGIDVQFAHDSIDLRSRGGRLSADIMAVVAADYVRNLRDEVKKGFYGRLKQGVYPLPAPIGYLDRGAGKPKEIDPVAGPLVKWAFERYAQGTISLLNLADELARRGLPSARGGRISETRVSRILHNPFYMGIIRINRTGESFQGAHKALVSKATFDAVQEVLQGRTPKPGIRRGFLFRHFAQCGYCGRYLTGEFKKQRYSYYRCYEPHCRGSVLKEEIIDAVLSKIARLVVLTPEEIGDLRAMALEELATGGNDAETRKHDLKMRLSQCDDRLTRLTDALIDGMIEKDAYDARKGALLAERRQLQDALEDPTQTAPAAEIVLHYLELPDIAQLRYDTAEPEDRRAIGDILTWNFAAYGKEPVFALHSPYREIAEWRNSHTVDRIVARQEESQHALFEKLKEASSAGSVPSGCP